MSPIEEYQSRIDELISAPGETDIVVAARRQIGVTVGYDPAYRKIGYPGGDVPRESGVCTDVIIRALRDARKIDMQKLVHEDMKSDFSQYPQMWGLKAPDANIDHRRVPNLQCYFKRKGFAHLFGIFYAGFAHLFGTINARFAHFFGTSLAYMPRI